MNRLRKYITWIREGRAFGFRPYFEWKSWLLPGSYNWISITPIKLEIEYERMGPEWRIEFMLMGVGFYLSAAMPWETEQSRELARRVKDMEDDPTFGGRVQYHPDAARELRQAGVDLPAFPNNPPNEVEKKEEEHNE